MNPLYPNPPPIPNLREWETRTRVRINDVLTLGIDYSMVQQTKTKQQEGIQAKEKFDVLEKIL